MAAPVIIELAVNGATPRSANPHVPRTPEEIAEVAVAAIERGAASPPRQPGRRGRAG